jgi:bifunctional enzyme CysN/CysC
VESGTVKVGDELIFSPSNKSGVIKTIEAWSVENQPETAEASQSIGFTLTEQIFAERGDVAALKTELPIISTTFDVNVFWMGKRHLEKGRSYTLKLTTQEVTCEVVGFKKVVDASTLETLEDQDYLAKNDVAEVTLRTTRPVAFDLFGSIPTTGRFVLVDEYDVCGGGIITTYTPSKTDRLRDEIRHRDFHWLKSDIKPEERAYRNGHQSALILIVGPSGTGKAKLARHLEHKLFELNYQSYLLDGRNVALGVSADIESQHKKQEGEVVRRFGEVAKLFLDAGHVVISTSNVFNQEDHSDLRLLVEPCPVVEIFVTDDEEPEGNFEIKLSQAETEKEIEAANTVYKYLKDKKILTGHNYSI